MILVSKIIKPYSFWSCFFYVTIDIENYNQCSVYIIMSRNPNHFIVGWHLESCTCLIFEWSYIIQTKIPCTHDITVRWSNYHETIIFGMDILKRWPSIHVCHDEIAWLWEFTLIEISRQVNCRIGCVRFFPLVVHIHVEFD